MFRKLVLRAAIVAAPLTLMATPATASGPPTPPSTSVNGVLQPENTASRAAITETCLVHNDVPRLNTAGARYVYSYASLDCTMSEPHIQLISRIWKKRWYGWEDVTTNFHPVNAYWGYFISYTGAHSCSNSTTSNTFRSTAEAHVWWRNGTNTGLWLESNGYAYACG